MRKVLPFAESQLSVIESVDPLDREGLETFMRRKRKREENARLAKDLTLTEKMAKALLELREKGEISFGHTSPKSKPIRQLARRGLCLLKMKEGYVVGGKINQAGMEIDLEDVL